MTGQTEKEEESTVHNSKPMENDDDSFKARVRKVFGSLSSLPAWSLTDEEVEKKEWNRTALKQGNEDDDQTLCSSSYDGLFKPNRMTKGLPDDDDDDDDGCEGRNNDVWEIRSSIGLDSTLDNEEEEDEYDRVAEGRMGAADRLYMKNITDQVASSSDPSGLNIHRDPRANHMAAQVRLKEDAVAAEKCETHFDGITLSGKQQRSTEPLVDSKVKPILKKSKKSENGGVKSMKRVRFDPSCKDESEQEVSWASANSENESNLGSSSKPKKLPPDYVLNPSKYTRYSLDSSDDMSNSQVCEYLHEEAKKSGGTMDVTGTNPSTVLFVPRQKKNINAIAAKDDDTCNESLHPLVGIAAGEAQQSEDPMEEDTETHSIMADYSSVSQKPERRYRSKAEIEEDSVS